MVPPAVDAIRAAARTLARDASLRGRFGRSARAYAEAAFDIDDRAAKFDAVLSNRSEPEPLVGALQPRRAAVGGGG